MQILTKDLGIFINTKKTRIVSLNHFNYLKLHYSLLEDGRVIVRTTNESFRRERKRLNKLKRRLENKKITFDEILNGYKSWRGSVKIYGNHFRLMKIDGYFNKLFNQKGDKNYD